MATIVQIALLKAGAYDSTKRVARSKIIAQETKTITTTADQFTDATATATLLGGNVAEGIWRVTVSSDTAGEVALVHFGTNPTAVRTPQASIVGHLCTPGVHFFSVMQASELASVILL